ncbi:hypothetical protein EZV62_028233 [Acer yangbiense]|uniref:Malectin-like domain-containing protein n=1 Tax=Acer yangbiense TaxID=1000413 RepID=A0A5C7GNZ9_9ROSI|nr:hypothetical protein EZV62_028233 [Acer yangbiense]
MVAYFFNLQNWENQKTVMEISKHFLVALLSSFVVAVFVHCEDQSVLSNKQLWYRDDIYDRIWRPYITSTQLSTKSSIASSDDYHPAESVMSTALTLENSNISKALPSFEGVLSSPSVPLPVDRFGEMCISAGGKSCEVAPISDPRFSVCDSMQQWKPEMKTKVVWNLHNEIAKVIERGLALGFDFNGKKKMMLEIIVRKGKNDNSCDENPNLRCYEKKKNKLVVPLVASAAAVLFTLLIALAIWLRFKRRKEQDRNASNLSWESRLQIAMDAAQVITNNFNNVGLEYLHHGCEDENVHITQWVIDMLGNGDITNIVDPSLEGDFETNSAWKAVELALACASHVSSKRPTMNDVVTELKECLAMETTRKKNDRGSEANSVREIFTMNNMDTEFSTPRER